MSSSGGGHSKAEWRGEGFRKLIEPEALTAAILPRQHILEELQKFVKTNPFIKRDLLDASAEEAA